MNSNLLKFLKNIDDMKKSVTKKDIDELELALSKYTYLYMWSPIYTNEIKHDILTVYDECVKDDKTLLFFYRSVFMCIYDNLLNELNNLHGSLKDDYQHDLNIINHCLYYYLY